MPWGWEDDEYRLGKLKEINQTPFLEPKGPLTGPELLARCWPDYDTYLERKIRGRKASLVDRRNT